MSHMCKFLFLIIATITVYGLSCARQSGTLYEADKASPNGTYRVKVEVVAEKPKGTRAYTEHGRFQFFKGQEIIETQEWENSDRYEPSFLDTTPVIEWLADNLLRMGQDRSNQLVYDELIVSNNTDEYLKYVDVSYGTFETFFVFDLAPGSRITLQGSSGFKQGVSGVPNSSLGYGGKTQNGREFHGALNGRERKSPADGPLKFQIDINIRDLK